MGAFRHNGYFKRRMIAFAGRTSGTFDTPYINGWTNFVWYDKDRIADITPELVRKAQY